MTEKKTKIENIEQVVNSNIRPITSGTYAGGSLKLYSNGEGLIVLPNGFKISLTAEQVAALDVK